MFLGAYLNKLVCLWCPVTEISSVQGVHQVRRFFAEKQKQGLLPKVSSFFKKNLDNVQSPKKEDCISNFVRALIPCLFTLDLVMQALVGLHKVQCRAVHFCAVWFSTSYTNLRWLPTFKKLTSSCILVNTVMPVSTLFSPAFNMSTYACSKNLSSCPVTTHLVFIVCSLKEPTDERGRWHLFAMALLHCYERR